jgi:hypothetical protein
MEEANVRHCMIVKLLANGSKAVPLHAMDAHVVRGGTAPTHS